MPLRGHVQSSGVGSRRRHGLGSAHCLELADRLSLPVVAPAVDDGDLRLRQQLGAHVAPSHGPLVFQCSRGRLAYARTSGDASSSILAASGKVASGGGWGQVIGPDPQVDMSRFPTSGHLVSWAGLCSRNDESAGKRRSTRVRKSGTWLKTTLVTAAWAAVRKKDSYLRSQFLRIKSRRGPKNAILAVAATMLTAAYYMLRDGVEYADLGADHYDRLDKTKAVRRLVRRLNELGCEVEIKHAA